MPHNTPTESVIIVGAGVFGLSTALAIVRRRPHTRVAVVDRFTPPVEDGSSEDTTRCIRADYADPIYARLAREAQEKIESDTDLLPYYFKQGMTFVCEGDPGRFRDIWEQGLANVKANAGGKSHVVIEMPSAENVFHHLHGDDAALPPIAELGPGRRWNQRYCNFEDAFIDAKETICVYYERCLAFENISFVCGPPVQRILTGDAGKTATGVMLDDGSVLIADRVLIAAGAWSPSLVDLQDLMTVSAIEMAWLKVTESEERKWKGMSIATNLSTGHKVFPPYNGEVKVLRRSPGYRNTVTIQHPEDKARRSVISYPRTTVANPQDFIPEDAEAALRDGLREIMPSLANRPFDRTKLCWLSQAPTADFIISPHPRIHNLHIATGGSAHAWKFLPIIGDLVLDSMEGILDPVLAEKWAWGRNGTDGGSAPRMAGDARELRDVVRSSVLLESKL